VLDEKSAMREQVREVLARMTADERARKSEDICSRVIASDLFARCGMILAYAPTGEEVDVMPIARAAIDVGKRVCFPSIDWESRTMRAVAVSGLGDESFVIHRHGVREPRVGEAVELGAGDLVLVPGMAFSGTGTRLGRGGGFYDRFLSGCSAHRLGVCFREQIRDGVQVMPYDVPMKTLVRDGGDMISVPNV